MACEDDERAGSTGVSPLEDGFHRSGGIEEKADSNDAAREVIVADEGEGGPSGGTQAGSGEVENHECPAVLTEGGHLGSPVSAAPEAAAAGAATDQTVLRPAVNLGMSLAGEPKTPMSAEMDSAHGQAPPHSPGNGGEGAPLHGPGGDLGAMVFEEDEEVSGGLGTGSDNMAPDEIARVAVAVEREATGKVFPGACVRGCFCASLQQREGGQGLKHRIKNKAGDRHTQREGVGEREREIQRERERERKR